MLVVELSRHLCKCFWEFLNIESLTSEFTYLILIKKKPHFGHFIYSMVISLSFKKSR